VQVEVLYDFDACESLREEWDRLMRELGADVYMTYDWCRTWWKYYGTNRQLGIFLFRQGATLVGVLPMFSERIRLGVAKIRLAKIIGSDSSLTLTDVTVKGGLEPQATAIDSAIRYWIGDQRCDAVHLGPLTGSGTTREAVLLACASVGKLASVFRDTVVGPHSSFDLPDTFDKYLGSLPKRQRQNFKRDVSLLSRNFEVGHQVKSDQHVTGAEFDAFAKMHEEQWRRDGKLGHFGDWPDSLEFNRELCKCMAALGRLRIYSLLANGKTVSCQYGFVFGKKLAWRLPARAPEPDWDRYGLGRLGLVRMLESAIGEGVRHIEAGLGHYDYKVQLGAREFDARSILVVSRRLRSRIRAKIFVAIAWGLHLSYYRMWFLRLSVRLGLKRRPLWKTWIRLRL
jgi:CelD/BcsL family acetyltransferase involved in cellulose biosynthesis